MKPIKFPPNIFWLFFLCILVLFSGCTPQNQGSGSTTTEQIQIIQSASYGEISLEQMYQEADFIFVGKIIQISSTQWNQDNGEYWNDETTTGETALQVHTIEVEPIQSIVDNLGQEGTVKITILGSSPMDGSHADHDLKVGMQVMFFTQEREIAWRGGMKMIVGLMGAPSYSYFTLGEDGLYHGALLTQPISLQEVMEQISDLREP
ncbi:MAG: hypothetical protein Fur0022_18940 [Anaerolineales bacterium]